MNLLDFVALVLAADAVVTAWFYGSIFQNRRETMTEKGGFFGDLAGCPLCFSYYPPFFLVMLLVVPLLFLPFPYGDLLKLPMYSLAATTLVHFLQGIRPYVDEEADDSKENKDGQA